MPHRPITDLTGITVEHMVGATDHKGMVKLRAESTEFVLVGQVPPDDARELATNIIVSAARAEYEQDFIAAATVHGLPDEMVATFLALVRQGELIRRTVTSGLPVNTSVTPPGGVPVTPSDGG